MYEKVNPKHPDKIADRIAGALVDLAYKEAENPRIAVEVLIGHGKCHIIAETSVRLNLEDVTSAVHRIAEANVVVDYVEVHKTYTYPIIKVERLDAETMVSSRACHLH